MARTEIAELTDERAWREAYPVMDQLRPVGEDAFVDRVAEMREADGYRLFALRADGAVRGLAGIAVQENLDHGKHVWVHDLVVDESHRGEGHGGRLLAWIESWAADRDCECVELASGLWRDDAHEFYEDAGFERYCYTFVSNLDDESE